MFGDLINQSALEAQIKLKKTNKQKTTTEKVKQDYIKKWTT